MQAWSADVGRHGHHGSAGHSANGKGQVSVSWVERQSPPQSLFQPRTRLPGPGGLRLHFQQVSGAEGRWGLRLQGLAENTLGMTITGLTIGLVGAVGVRWAGSDHMEPDSPCPSPPPCHQGWPGPCWGDGRGPCIMRAHSPLSPGSAYRTGEVAYRDAISSFSVSKYNSTLQESLYR